MKKNSAVNNQLATTVFCFESKEVRTLTRNGEAWFVAADVCAALGLDNPTMALRRLEHDEKMTSILLRVGLGMAHKSRRSFLNQGCIAL